LITKWGLALGFGTTLAGAFRIIPPMYLILNLHRVIHHFELWRLLTCFPFMGGLSFHFVMMMVMWYRYSGSLETSVFEGRTADYLFMLIFGMCVLLVPMAFFNLPIGGMGIIMMVIYYWSRKNAERTITFMFGIQFAALWLPWVLMGFTLLTGGFPFVEFLGVLTGHLYLFLDETVPRVYLNNRPFLRTPSFLYSWFPPQLNRNVPRMQQAAAAQGRGHAWGQGRALGE